MFVKSKAGQRELFPRRWRKPLCVLAAVLLIAGFCYRPRIRAKDCAQVVFVARQNEGMSEFVFKRVTGGEGIRYLADHVNTLFLYPLPYNELGSIADYALVFLDEEGKTVQTVQCTYRALRIGNRCYGVQANQYGAWPALYELLDYPEEAGYY